VRKGLLAVKWVHRGVGSIGREGRVRMAVTLDCRRNLCNMVLLGPLSARWRGSQGQS
jgi:hypothetical protein